MPILMMLAAGLATFLFSGEPGRYGIAAELLGTSCNIKGNVSIDSGERIYHVPGQKFYSQTRISPEWGERWFCSEAEARKAGWRKAKR